MQVGVMDVVRIVSCVWRCRSGFSKQWPPDVVLVETAWERGSGCWGGWGGLGWGVGGLGWGVGGVGGWGGIEVGGGWGWGGLEVAGTLAWPIYKPDSY